MPLLLTTTSSSFIKPRVVVVQFTLEKRQPGTVANLEKSLPVAGPWKGGQVHGQGLDQVPVEVLPFLKAEQRAKRAEESVSKI
jgi:hypothetical protein